jgi:hypothetical protein
MAEYIEREPLTEIMEGLYNHHLTMGNYSADSATQDCIEAVINAPAADVVEVSKVAKILYDAFSNDCPCNFKNVDEWLPYVCEYANTCDCSSVKCWEQLIKHYGERKCENG